MAFAVAAPLILASLSVGLAAVSAYVDLQSHRSRKAQARRRPGDQATVGIRERDVSQARRYPYFADLTIFVCGSGAVASSLLAIRFEPNFAELAAGAVGAMIAAIGLIRLVSRPIAHLWRRERRTSASVVAAFFAVVLVFALSGAAGGFVTVWSERPDTCLPGEWAMTSRVYSDGVEFSGLADDAVFTGRAARLVIGGDFRGAFGDGTWITYEAQVGARKIVRRSNVTETFSYSNSGRSRLYLTDVNSSGIEEQQVDGGEWTVVRTESDFASADSADPSRGRVYDYVCTRSTLTLTADGQTADFQRK